MAYRIIPRSEWGARHQGGFYDRPVGNLRRYLHHSVTIAPDLVPPFTDDYAAVRELEAIGQERFAGGISYTFAITPAGLIFEGHGIGRIGAHTAGYNTIAAGICLIGNYEKDQPTPQQLAALDWLLHEGVRKRWWTSPTLTGGHRDTKSTACPGKNAYALIAAVNAGKYHNVTPTSTGGFMADLTEKQQKDMYKAATAKVKDGERWLEPHDAERVQIILARRNAAKLEALTAAMGVLASSVGVDPKVITATVNKAVTAALADLKITLSTEA
jgi:hypothetical protein